MKHLIAIIKNTQAMLLAAALISFTAYGQEEKKEDEKEDKKEEPYNGLVLKANEHWSLKFSGLINAFYTHTRQKEDPATGAKAVTYHSIQNGINGALLILNPTYKKGDLTIKGNFMFSMGVNSHGLWGNQQIAGFNFASFDVRQASATVSNPKWGSVTFGRDFGIVGLDAILQDVTFLGVGANWNFGNPSYVTLSGIGYGYPFVDKMAQITYTTPKFLDAVTASVGVFEPYSVVFFSRIKGTKIQKPEGIGVHAKVDINKSFGDVAVHVSSSLITQKVSEYKDSSDKVTNNDLTAYGIDVFANVGYKGFNLTGYYYSSNGAGVDGLQFRPIVELSTGDVELVKGHSYYGQLTYKTSNPKSWLFGVIHGATIVKDVTVVGEVVTNSALTEQTSRRTSGVIGWQAHPNIALRAEYTVQDKGLFAPAPRYNIIVLGSTFYF